MRWVRTVGSVESARRRMDACIGIRRALTEVAQPQSLKARQFVLGFSLRSGFGQNFSLRHKASLTVFQTAALGLKNCFLQKNRKDSKCRGPNGQVRFRYFSF
jgi:hypothetical protein